MDQKIKITAGFLLVFTIGAGFYLNHRASQEAAAAAEAEREFQARRAEEQARYRRQLRENSASRMPQVLRPLALGMSLDEAQQARPDMRRDPTMGSTDPDEMMLGEELSNGARVVYVFDRESRQLRRVQILSTLPSAEAIGMHLRAMNREYGQPTGIWNCPNTEGVPTRRFTWRNDPVTVADIFLVHPGGVAVTLDIASSGVMYESLRRSQCRPLRGPEEIGNFPIATPEQLGATGQPGLNR